MKYTNKLKTELWEDEAVVKVIGRGLWLSIVTDLTFVEPHYYPADS